MRSWLHNSIIVISLIFLGVILYFVEWKLVYLKLSSLNFYEWVLSIAAQALIFFFRARRYGAILPIQSSLRTHALLNLAIVHSFYLTLLPARLGDVYFAALAQRYAGVSKSMGFSILLFVRLYDVIFLALLVLLLVSIYNTLILKQYIIYVVLVIISGFLMVVFFTRVLKIIISIFVFLEKITNINACGVIADNFFRVILELSNNKSVFVHIFTFLLTALCWGCLIGIYWVLLTAFGVADAWLVALLLVVLSNLVLLIPISTVGGLGVSEVVLTYGLMFTGMVFTEAVTIAISLRIVILLIPIILALIWFSANVFFQFGHSTVSGGD